MYCIPLRRLVPLVLWLRHGGTAWFFFIQASISKQEEQACKARTLTFCSEMDIATSSCNLKSSLYTFPKETETQRTVELWFRSFTEYSALKAVSKTGFWDRSIM
jgi:hypothetical protein